MLAEKGLYFLDRHVALYVEKGYRRLTKFVDAYKRKGLKKAGM